jgi:hypothetical protein
MTLSAILMGVIGIACSFLPQEILQYFSRGSTTDLDPLIIQILGALYFASAMINWTAKANLIGGIYARPIAIGNFTHFAVGALALGKGYLNSHHHVILVPALMYGIFAVVFGIILFSHPIKSNP